MKEAFVQKKTHNAVTSALKRPRNGPLQESGVVLMFWPRSARRTSALGRTAHVKERMNKVYPAAPFLFAAGQEAHTSL